MSRQWMLLVPRTREDCDTLAGAGPVSVNALDAQVHPEAYRDLLVRVTGYIAHFTRLGRGKQDQIIARHEHTAA